MENILINNVLIIMSFRELRYFTLRHILSKTEYLIFIRRSRLNFNLVFISLLGDRYSCVTQKTIKFIYFDAPGSSINQSFEKNVYTKILIKPAYYLRNRTTQTI